MIYQLKGSGFWLDEAVDNLLSYLESLGTANETIVCAAGMTPSAPIHFGILREIAISSFVADELLRRNKKAKLVYYWDDYDHFCKIPYFTKKEDVAEHIGKTLREVPDFNGLYKSYGEHYMHEFEKCLHKCGFFPEYNYQSKMYKSGNYTSRIRQALNQRKEIFDIIGKSAGLSNEEINKRREDYYPLEVYCSKCGKDSTFTTGWQPEKDTITYTCKECGYQGSYILGSNFHGKLVWKVNWALRWSDDKVAYESSGENQLTDTGSYSVSSKVAETIFGGKVPFSLLYRFIGIRGIAKVSRAQGEKTLATRFTGVLEPCIVRWLLLKTAPNKPFSVDIEDGIFRIYHEWDCFVQKVQNGEATDIEKRIYELATDGVEITRFPIPFRTIITALGICGDNKRAAAQQMLKMTAFGGTAEELLKVAKPRIEAAEYWLYECGHAESQVNLKKDFNKKDWDTFSDECRKAVGLLCKKLDLFTNEDKAKEVLFNIPEELGIEKERQEDFRKEFFRCLYLLCLGTERGPKLTTLLCLTQKEKLLTLFSAQTIE